MNTIGPIVYPLFALTHLLIAVLALMQRDHYLLAASCLFVVELMTFYDSAVISVGNRLGISPLAKNVNRSRFFLHGCFISLLLFFYSGVGEKMGVAVFQTNEWQWLLLVLVLIISMIGFQWGFRKSGNIMPVNSFGCLRYAQSVSDLTKRQDYHYSDDEMAARAIPPIASILTVFIGLLISLWIGVAVGHWLLFLVSLMMILAGWFPQRGWGPLATSCIEMVFSAGLLWSLMD
jgi:hypothetical protein